MVSAHTFPSHLFAGLFDPVLNVSWFYVLSVLGDLGVEMWLA
jgi:hypothetical protein